ncbi:solute carrier family 35 member F3-like [Babylonia areolata]|uniref:solute carrier family 35 member F3-like n=1 Tax=Babylonia areolata TaxID=304850 RepID=UPI003FD42108
MSSSIAQQSVAEDTDIGGSDGFVELGIPVAGSSPPPKPSCVARHSRAFSGILVAMVTGVTWAGFTELVKTTDQSRNSSSSTSGSGSGSGGDSPLDQSESTIQGAAGLTYFFAAWLVLAFPPYLVVNVLLRHRSLKNVLGESVAIYAGGQGQEGRNWTHVWKTALLLVTWSLALYTYIQALARLNPADVTSLYATNHSFVYMLSWIVLFEKFVAIRILAMIFSITGIVLFAYVDAAGDPIWGVIIAVTSSSLTAIHKVLFSKFVGDANVGQATLFLTCLGLLSVILLWPIFTALQLTGAEAVDWGRAPWSLLAGSGALLLVFHVLGVCALHVTCKEAWGLGVALSVPLCAMGDTVWGGQQYTGMKLAAFVLITLGLLLILLPEDWTKVIVAPFKKRKASRHGRGRHSASGCTSASANHHTLRGRLTMTSYM